MADNSMTPQEHAKQALEDEKMQQDIQRRAADRKKEQVAHKDTGDWALL